MSALSNIIKTLLCVGIAGALFITSIWFNIKWLFLVAAFFDWLPLPTGWMKITGASDKRTKTAGIIHGVVTAIAYIIGIGWLLVTGINGVNLGYVFLVIWFEAVILGAYTTAVKLVNR